MSRNEVDHILFGAAYYDEYLMMKGIDRIDEDMKMMKDAGQRHPHRRIHVEHLRTAAGRVRLHLRGPRA